MRLGILTDKFNHESQHATFPLLHLTKKLTARGHDLVRLNFDDVTLDNNGMLKYSGGFKSGGPLDAYLSWTPTEGFWDMHKADPYGNVSYLEQNRILSDLYPSPTPYKAQMIVNNKMNMADMFRSCALPAPITLDGASHENRRAIINECATTGRPFVLKPLLGYGGHNVYRLDNTELLESRMAEFDKIDMPFLIQDYIESQGIDYRAYVIDGRVVAGIKRQAKDGDWRGNSAQGSTSSAFTFSAEQQKDAVRAMQGAALRFGAVDILIDQENGQHYICEINDSAGTHTIEAVHSGLDINELVADMIEHVYG
jgi:RimK family alpha-L-glutamate ligase